MKPTAKTSVALTLALLTGIWILGTADAASAHEGREVGDYEMVVGWGTEPALAGYPNSVQLLLSHHDGDPVTDLGDSLDAEVGYGDQTMAVTLEPLFEVGEFGTPGDYRAFLIPTRPGTYAFHFTGDIEGQAVDEEFTSGPETFAEVEEPGGQQFPVKDPSVAEVSDRLQQEVPRLTAQIDAAKDDASSARTIAFVGIGIGALGLAAAAVGMIARRKAA
jgi:hypothetical protein